ncbi:MAG: site-specific integrase [Proteobacteria bacterium]|nr:site-specific integrase [Pseudomonadota bacterium]
MNVKEAISLFRFYQQSNHRKRTADSYRFLLQHFDSLFSDHDLDFIKPDEIYHFLEQMTKTLSKSTRRLRYAQLKAFFNFIIEKCLPDLKNPCSAPLLSKTFRMPRQTPKTILEKEIVDEMIYNTKNQRNRLMLELMARCGLRIGELLNIRASDVSERRLTIRNRVKSNPPSSGLEDNPDLPWQGK